MKKIKFRAWDTKNKIMIMPEDGDNVVIALDGQCGKTFWELMQFTGLTDKNGKEIYEGDIVANLKGKGERYPYKVEWKDEWGEWILNLIPWQFDGLKERKIYNSIQAATRYEIIGNIYENPPEKNNKESQ